MAKIINIDGLYGSEGGQVLRTACSLAVITKKPCCIFNIRKNRPSPGLMPQHLIALQSLANICNGKVEGNFLGSDKINFYPGFNYKNKISVKIPTAESVVLILQSLLPVCIFSDQETEIEINGGATDTFFAPTFDYFIYVFLNFLTKMGGRVEINILRRGYYPQGGAKVKIKVNPVLKLKPLNLTQRDNLKRILAISGASSSLKEQKIAERQMAGINEILGKFKLPIEERVEYYETQCPGSQVCLIAEFENTMIGVDNLGKLGKKAEIIGQEVALDLLKEQKTEACLDKYLTDQILPYLALANGASKVTVSEITNHCKTNMWIIEKFLEGRFIINGNLIAWSPR